MPGSPDFTGRARRAALVSLVAYLGVSAYVLLGVLTAAGRPFPGLFVSHKGYVGLRLLASPEIELPPHGIAYADRLVAVDGAPFTNAAALRQRLAEIGIGGSATYRFERPDGTSYAFSGPVLALHDRVVFAGILPMMLGGAIAVLITLATLLARPRLQAAWAFYVGTWAGTMQLLILPFDTFLGQRLLPWSQLAGGVAYGALLHLGLSYPRTLWPLTRSPLWGAVCLYALAMVPWGVAIFRHDLPPAPIDTLGRALYVPAFSVLCLPLAANAITTALRSGDSALRQRARLIMPVALALAVLGLAPKVLVLPDVPLELRVGLCVLMITAVAGAFTYVVVKSNAFDVPLALRRAIVRSVVVGISLLAYLVLHASVHRFAGMGSAWATGVVAAALVAVLFVTLRPLRVRIEARLEDRLFPGQRAAREATLEVARQLAQVRDPSAVVPLLRAPIARVLGAPEARFLVAGSAGDLEELDPPAGARALDRELRQAAASLFDTRSAANLERDDPDADRAARRARERVGKHGHALAIPLPEGGATGGFLVASRGEAHPYTDAEVAFLETLAGQSAVALENARAWEEVHALQRRLADQNQYLKQELKQGTHFGEIVGESRALRTVLAQVRQVANTSATVLIAGETGTGKELIARAIHATSPRRDQLLVKLACAAVPETLFESELFGHEKGAFTGADRRTQGRFEVADGGTLLLDDVDALPLAVQAKLLRALQEGEIQRLGSHETRSVDVRIIASTNKDLAQEVRAGRFREDLYYRLNVVPIAVPPLRERPEDIPILVQHFVALEAERHGRAVEGISWASLEELRSYPWPGNIRELRNVVERAVVLSNEPVLRLPGPLTAAPDAAAGAGGAALPDVPDGANLDDLVRAYKIGLITRTLASVGGNHRRAALKLGIHRSSLTRLVHKLGIHDGGA